MLGGHERRAAPHLAQGERRRPAHQLGADDDRALAHAPSLEVHKRLKLACGEHSGWPIARYPSRRPGPLTGASGEHHRARADQFAAERAGDLEGETVGPPGGHGPRAHVSTSINRGQGEASGVVGTLQHASHVAQPVARVVAVARNAPGLRLALEHHHRAHAGLAQRSGRGEPGRAAADHHDVSVGLARSHRDPSASIDSTSAPQ
ncbi:unannotated protein [freshwater metagenome]|uniref:Unannotated protein n=1 Tax=freshwater metagenome TaxID=449393 RepID=A0A6J7IEM5_9ZZZZ